MKTIEHYMGLDYPATILRHITRENEPYWVAKNFDLPGCMSDGETPNEAISNLADARLVWIESYLEDGLEVPEPSKDYEKAEYEDRLFFTLSDGKEYCNDELALSILLKDDVLFANAFDYSYGKGVIAGHTVVLFVCCNDVFEWGFADSETFSTKDIGPLVKSHLRDKRWGAQKWAILHRQYRPQPPVEKAMREAGVWDDDLEKLERSHALE